MIVTVPPFSPVTIPALLTVAFVFGEALQVTVPVKFFTARLLYSPVASNCSAEPTAMEVVVVGVIVIHCKVGSAFCWLILLPPPHPISTDVAKATIKKSPTLENIGDDTPRQVVGRKTSLSRGRYQERMCGTLATRVPDRSM